MEVEAEVYCELQIPVYLRGCLQGAGFILRGVMVYVGGMESRFLLAQGEPITQNSGPGMASLRYLLDDGDGWWQRAVITLFLWEL